MNISPLLSAPDASALSPEQIASNSKLSEAEKVKALSGQFEAVLLRQILHEAQKTVISSNFSLNSSTSGIYQDMVTAQLAEQISRSGDFGLARSLEQQLTRQLLSKPQAGDTHASSTPEPD